LSEALARKQPEIAQPMTGTRKAAIFLMAMGETTGAEILRQLTQEEVQHVTREVARVGTVTPEQAETVLEEFSQMCLARELIVQGGVDYAKKMLFNTYGMENGKKLLDLVLKNMGTDVANIDALHKADAQQLAKLIHNENPQTIALILSHLMPAHSAAVVASLPAEIRADVLMRMAGLDQVSPEIINKIASVVREKLRGLGDFSREAHGGLRSVAETLNRLESNLGEEMLASITESDAELAESIRNLMFVFEDLRKLDKEAMNSVLGKIDRKVLTVALKGTSEELKAHFMQSMSERAIEMLREDMDALGPVKIKDVEAAQQQIIALTRQLQAEGVLNLKGGGEERYIA
jgi:flagellar motor switch protein FliG